jgi:hypothetical protein
MATQKGTLKGYSLLSRDPNGSGRATYLATFSFPAYTGSSDSGQIDGPAAALSAAIKDGKTRALISSCVPVCVGGGRDTEGQAVFVGAVTISTADLTFNLTAADGTTELTSSTASDGVQLAITVLES